MTLEELNKYIEKVNNTEYEDIDTDELISFAVNVIEDYENKNKSKELQEGEYEFLIKYFHKYAENKYDHETKFDIKESNGNSFYDPNTDSIQYSKAPMKVNLYPAIWNIFDVLHENRHGVQWSQYKTEPDQILNIDPIAILTLKELFLSTYRREIYNKNHNDMVLENDASLCANNTIVDFINKYLPNKEKYLADAKNKASKEKDNYTKLLMQGFSDMEFSNVEEGTLPVVFEEDKIFKEKVSSEWIANYPLLKLICKEDGTLKSYKELNEDKEQLKKIHEGKKISRNDSLSDFKGRKERLATEHIDTVYSLIINSDPILYIEDCMNYGRVNKIQELLQTTPELLKTYGNQITSVVTRNVSMDNYEKYANLFKGLNREDISNKIEKRVDNIVRRNVKNMYDISMEATKDDEGEDYKSVDELENENSELINRLDECFANKKINEKHYKEYKKRISRIYRDYKKESKENNPDQELKSEDVIGYDYINKLMDKYGYTIYEIEEIERRMQRDIERDNDNKDNIDYDGLL